MDIREDSSSRGFSRGAGYRGPWGIQTLDSSSSETDTLRCPLGNNRVWLLGEPTDAAAVARRAVCHDPSAVSNRRTIATAWPLETAPSPINHRPHDPRQQKASLRTTSALCSPAWARTTTGMRTVEDLLLFLASFALEPEQKAFDAVSAIVAGLLLMIDG